MCGWCDDTTPDHKHYSVLVRQLDGKLLGRLTPSGTTNSLKIYAAVLSRARANKISAEINNAGDYLAKTIEF